MQTGGRRESEVTEKQELAQPLLAQALLASTFCRVIGQELFLGGGDLECAENNSWLAPQV